MATGTIKQIKTKDIPLTCGTTQYNGYYYADHDLANEPFKLDDVISVFVVGSTDGHFATAFFPFHAFGLSGGIRVMTTKSGGVVTVRVKYNN